jgi:glutamyl-tRNA synthetase
LYRRALDMLAGKGLLYPCFCTRAELRALAGAPHLDDAGAPYPGTCRHLSETERAARTAAGKKAALRLACPPDAIWRFTDGILGEQRFTLAEVGGDFALRRSDGVYAYQLAVSVDDMAMGVNRIVRGRDILRSTPRQLYLWDLLSAAFARETATPRYAHLPLLLDKAGERLAKRHASLSLRALREAGVKPERIIGYLARLAGFAETAAPMPARRLAGQAASGGDLLIDRIAPGDVSLPEDPVSALRQ